MPVQVAQLLISVEADATQAVTTLGALNAAYQTAAQAAQAGSAQSSAAEEHLAEAISAVVLAQRAQQAAVVQSLSQIDQSINGVQQRAQQVRSSVGGIGGSASQGLYQMNSALLLTGQNMGVFSNSITFAASSLQRMSTQSSATARSIAGLGAALAIAGALVVNFSTKQEAAMARLNTAIENSGHNIENYQGVIDQATKKGEGWGYSHAEVANALARLAPVTENATQLMLAFQAAADYAAFTNRSLSATVDKVIRGMAGASRGLRELGIQETLVADLVKKHAAAHEQFLNKAQALGNARANLADAEQRYRTQLEASALAVDQIAKAYQTLERAQRSLQDVKDLQAARHKEDQAAADKEIANLDKMADASNRVLDAQLKLQAAHGGGIAEGQRQLKEAIDKQREALDKQAEAQRRAASGGTEEQKIRDAIELRNATERITDAEAGVTQAFKDQRVDAMRLSDAHLAVEHAARSLAKAETERHEAWVKAHDLEMKLHTQKQHVLELIEGIVRDQADAHEKTSEGFFQREKARLEDWLAHWGSTIGGIITGLGGLISTLALVKLASSTTAAGTVTDMAAIELAGETAGVSIAAGFGMAAAAVAGFVAAYAGTTWLLNNTPLGGWIDKLTGGSHAKPVQLGPAGKAYAAQQAKLGNSTPWEHTGAAPSVTINVAGSVVTHRDLVNEIRDGLIELGYNNGGIILSRS